jgi:hypothetical protein
VKLKGGLAAMANPIIESGMPFIADNAFHIENSAAYITLGCGIKSVEFVRRKNEFLMFVEAKSTFPNPNKSEERFDGAADDIAEKFVHSVNLYASITLDVYTEDTSALSNSSCKNSAITLVLVIRDHKTEWCKRVKNKLDLLLNQSAYFREIWRPKVFVINYASAIEFGIAENALTA